MFSQSISRSRKITNIKNNFSGPDWLQGFIKCHCLMKCITDNVKASRAEVNEDVINDYFNHSEETLKDAPIMMKPMSSTILDQNKL